MTDHSIVAYFAQADSAYADLLIACRDLVFQTLPSIKEEWKWGAPCYRLRKQVCYLKVAKTHLTFGFFNGGELKDDTGKLFGGDNPTMRHLRLKGFEDFNVELIADLLRQSAAING